MRKCAYIIIGLACFILGAVGGLTSIKIPLVIAAGLIVLAVILLDYEKVTYIVIFYVVIDYVLRQVVKNDLLSSFWDDLLLVFCIFLWLFKWFVYRRQKAYRWTPLDFPLILFFGVGIFLLIANSDNIRVGIDGFRAVAEFMLWYFVTVQLLKTPESAARLLYILVITGGAIGAYGVYQYIIGAEIPANWIDMAEQTVRTRVFSIIGSPNILGSLMILLIPLCISIFSCERKTSRKLVFGCIALIMTACLIFTLSRMALIGFVIALCIYFFMRDRRLIIPILVAVVLVMVFIPPVVDRFTYLFSSDYLTSSMKGGRLGRWSIGLGKFLDNLWLGVGLGRFGGAVAKNYNIASTFYMDNYFLKTAVEMGLLGLSAFCALIYNAIAHSIRTLKQLHDRNHILLVQGALAGMCGVVVHNFVENVFEVPMMVTYFWILAGIIMFLGYANRQETALDTQGNADAPSTR